MNNKEFKTVKCSGGIVKNSTDQIALILMDDIRIWDFPKGGIEKNESEIDAAKREIYEETGLKNLTLVKKLDNYIRPAANGNPIIMDIFMFLFTTDQEKIFPVENDIKEAKWVDKDMVNGRLTLPEAREYFEKIMNEI